VSVTGRAAGGGGDVETTGVALAGDAPEEEGIGIDDDGFRGGWVAALFAGLLHPATAATTAAPTIAKRNPGDVRTWMPPC
jgi:hypothetical protein